MAGTPTPESEALLEKLVAALIRKGLKTLDDVPANLRDTVAKLLEESTDA